MNAGRLTRRGLLRAGVAAAAAPALARALDGSWPEAAHAASPWGEPEYWAFADRCQSRLDDLWSPARRCYDTGSWGETGTNGCILFTHAAAALANHQGPARNDERARALAARLLESPPFMRGASIAQHSAEPIPYCDPDGAARVRTAGDQTHVWGWGTMMSTTIGQHVVVDTPVIRGLGQAWLARDQLALPQETREAIRGAVARCAFSTFYTWPALRLNQINWPIEIYAWSADVTENPHLIQHDCRQQLGRFADGLAHRVAGFQLPFTGAGYRFHYLPQSSASRPFNLDSAEYANIVCTALLFYERARRAGMPQLTATQEWRLRAWVERVLCGYWTHAGYLNWDTGLSFDRWHQAKKQGLSQTALMAIALAPRFQPSAAHGRWAKHLFDRGFEYFERQVAGEHDRPAPVPFSLSRTGRTAGDGALYTARTQCNAAMAATFGLGERPSEEPPPLYAYDPDIGRLAVTTPAYNTAILAVNQGAVPYGGMELARLFDGDQRVAALIGGRPPASFGVVVRDHRSGRTTESQRGRMRPSLDDPPLRLTRAPRGTGRHLMAHPRRAYAGAFKTLEAEGWTRSPDVGIRSRHRFRASFVETEWTIIPRSGAGRQTVHVLFPSWGHNASVSVLTHDGRTLPLIAGKVALADAVAFHVAGADGGYVVVPRSARRGRAHLLRVAPQASAPRPGPTLALELLDAGRPRRLQLTVRIAPVADARHAVQAAARLRR